MTTYQIHPALSIIIDSDSTNYRRYFENEYRRIHRDTERRIPHTSITVRTVKTLPHAEEDDILETRRFKKLFNFSYLIRGLNTSTVELYFESHWLDRVYINAIAVFVQAQLLEPIVYKKLLEQRVLMLHAAGVERDGKAILLPAHGGTGKTTLSLKLCARGYRMLGDDLLLVDLTGGSVYPYARPFHLFNYNIGSLEGAKLPLKYQFIIRIKDIIRLPLQALTREEFLISTRVHADELYSGDIFGSVADVDKIVFLTKQGPISTVVNLVDPDQRFEAAQRIVASADLNDSLYKNIIGDHETSSQIQELELSVTADMLSLIPEMTLFNTREASEGDLDRLFDVQISG